MSLTVTGVNYSTNQHKKVAFGAKVPINGLVETIAATRDIHSLTSKNPSINRILSVCDTVTGGKANEDGAFLAPDHCVARLLYTIDENSPVGKAIIRTVKKARLYFGQNTIIDRTPQESQNWIDKAITKFKKEAGLSKASEKVEVIDPPPGGLGHERLMQNPDGSYYSNLNMIDRGHPLSCNFSQQHVLSQEEIDELITAFG